MVLASVVEASGCDGVQSKRRRVAEGFGVNATGAGDKAQGASLGLGLLAYVVSWWVGRSVRVGGSSCPDTSMVRGRTARSTYGAIRACDVGCRGIARGPSTL